MDEARSNAEAAQRVAKQTLLAHGVNVTELTPEAIKDWRTQAMKDQSALAENMGIPRALMLESEKFLAKIQ